MADQYSCPYCGKQGISNFDIAGSQILCEQCAATLTIPATVRKEMPAVSHFHAGNESVSPADFHIDTTTVPQNPYGDPDSVTGARQDSLPTRNQKWSFSAGQLAAMAAAFLLLSLVALTTCFALFVSSRDRSAESVATASSDSASSDTAAQQNSAKRSETRLEKAQREEAAELEKAKRRIEKQRSALQQMVDERNAIRETAEQKAAEQKKAEQRMAERRARVTASHSRESADKPIPRRNSSARDKGGPSTKRPRVPFERLLEGSDRAPDRIAKSEKVTTDESTTDEVTSGNKQEQEFAFQTESATGGLRKWRSSDGSFSVEARLLSQAAGKVRLEKLNGRILVVPLTSLSVEDKEFVNAGKPVVAENPFKSEQPDRADQDNVLPPDQYADTPKDPITLVPAKPLKVKPGIDWTFKPEDTLSKQATPSGEWTKARILPLDSLSDLPDKRTFGFAANASGVAVVCSGSPKRSHTSVHVFEMGDASEGENAFLSRMPMKSAKVCSVSPSGRTFVTFQQLNGSREGRLDFWQQHRGRLNALKSWRMKETFAPKVRTARFISEKRLLTVGRQISLWDIESDKAIFTIDCKQLAVSAVSHDDRYLAWLENDALSIMRLSDGRILGSVNTPSDEIQSLAFSPNGQQLAGAGMGLAKIWDLNDGSVVRELRFGGTAFHASRLDWPAEDYLLIAGSKLLDIPHGIIIWKYAQVALEGHLHRIHGNQFCYVVATAGRSTRVIPTAIPHQDMKAFADEQGLDKQLWLKPGSQVGLEIKLRLPEEELADVHEESTLRFASRGAGTVFGGNRVFKKQHFLRRKVSQTPTA